MRTFSTLSLMVLLIRRSTPSLTISWHHIYSLNKLKSLIIKHIKFITEEILLPVEGVLQLNRNLKTSKENRCYFLASVPLICPFYFEDPLLSVNQFHVFVLPVTTLNFDATCKQIVLK